MLTSEAFTPGSSGQYLEEVRLKGWKEDREQLAGAGCGVRTGQDWFFGKAKQRVGHGTVGHH